MQQTIANNGVAKIEELRELSQEAASSSSSAR